MDVVERFAPCILRLRRSALEPSAHRRSIFSVTPKNFSMSTGAVVLTGVPLRTVQDLVLLRSRVRAAAEQFGLDQRRVRSFSCAAYEAASLLFAEDAGSAEVAVTESGGLEGGGPVPSSSV